MAEQIKDGQGANNYLKVNNDGSINVNTSLEVSDVDIGDVNLLNVTGTKINPATEDKQDEIINKISKLSSYITHAVDDYTTTSVTYVCSMESEKKDRVRHSLMIEGELHSYVQDLSEKQGRSYNSMLNILFIPFNRFIQNTNHIINPCFSIDFRFFCKIRDIFANLFR